MLGLIQINGLIGVSNVAVVLHTCTLHCVARVSIQCTTYMTRTVDGQKFAPCVGVTWKKPVVFVHPPCLKSSMLTCWGLWERRLCEGTKCRNTSSCTSLPTLNIRGERGARVVCLIVGAECCLKILLVDMFAIFCLPTIDT